MNSIEIEKKVKEILKELPSESALLDYKEIVYKVEKKHDFIKDVIAMLNSLESIGENKYIIFGVSDEKELLGIKDDLFIRNNTLVNWFENYIFPIPLIDVGTVSFKDKKFGYICISKYNTNYIYEVKEDVVGDPQNKLSSKNAVFKGQAFFRRGSKNEVMTQEDREKFLLNENSVFSQQHILKLENRIKEFENRIPDLKLGLKLLGSINDEENKFEGDEYNFSKNIKIKGKDIQQNYILKKIYNFDEFSEDDKKYITKEDVDNYNKAIIEKSDEIDKYNLGMFLYNFTYENGQIFDFLVKNDGTVKANSIIIIIEFAKDIFIQYKENIISENGVMILQKPIPPDIPENPVEKVEREKIKQELTKDDEKDKLHDLILNKDKLTFFLANVEKTNKLFSNLNKEKILNFERMNNLYLKNYNKLLEENKLFSQVILDSVNNNFDNFVNDFRPIVKIIKNNRMEITIENGLLHTSSEKIENICIIPTKTGKFDVKVSIICEEYPKPQEYIITFEVEDK